MFLNWMIALIGGALAASNLIIGMQPKAKEYLDKLAPYQGFAGIFLVLWGLYNVLDIPDFIKLLGATPVTAIAAIVMVVMMIVVGFILGFGLIAKYALSKNEQAKAKGEAMLAKLAPLTGTFGIALIVATLWLVLNAYVLKMAL